MSSSILERAANLLRLAWSVLCFAANSYTPFFSEPYFRLKQVCRGLDCLEKYERAGYQLRRNHAVGLMRNFAQHRLIESKDMRIEDKWYELDDEFRSWASGQRLSTDCTLYDLVAMSAHEAQTLPFMPLRRYAALAHCDWSEVPAGCGHKLSLNLCEKATRGFYRTWALQSLMAKTDNRLSLECCELIVDDPSVKNEDLFNMILQGGPPYEPTALEKFFGYAINCGAMIFMIMLVRNILSNLEEPK